MLSGCFTDATITWTEGTWTTVEQGTAQGQDGCNLMAQLETLEPFRYSVGPTGPHPSDEDTGYRSSTSADALHDDDSSPKNLLKESALEAGQQSIWNICEGYPNPEFYCSTNLQLLHHEQWAADAVKAFCGDDVDLSEASIRANGSSGLLLNPDEILINSFVEIRCPDFEEDYDEEDRCESQYTVRLRPQPN